ncbi:signal peptidase I [Modestobacter sp. I12A-02628]|uniref:Signal peptidase I n=1 Tax=Goekera deserti TaxID=2497753 RepID=A0A7K3WJS2_9ACTN|nr:signal peptidase I [Goekera deserti]MPQ97264.1 signal peptidase I [Goekera deserti]NDI50225.1 signal peptidase I [Goekera deserti]NEL55793.1 signal peptidase I [Goekera deserti]
MSSDRSARPGDPTPAADDRTPDASGGGPEPEAQSPADAAGDVAGEPDRAVDEPQASARSRRRRRAAAGNRSLLRELPVLLVVAFVLALLVKTFLVQAFFIPSGSMERTLHGCPGCTGDRVLVNKVPYWFGEPQPGDIVVFRGPDTWSPEISVAAPDNWLSSALLTVGRTIGVAPPSEDDYVKRVIATGGQTVQCCNSEGRVTVDGEPLDEPYIFEPKPLASRSFGPVTVPEGRLWVMGDHRSASADSTAHVTDRYAGTIAVDDVIGKAALIVWPLDRFGVLDSPDIQGVEQAAAAGAGMATVAPHALGLAVAVPVTRWRRRAGGRRARTGRGLRLSGPSRRPPGTGWRRSRPAPRTRPGRETPG